MRIAFKIFTITLTVITVGITAGIAAYAWCMNKALNS